MNTKQITKVNNVAILVSKENDLVPIKPICEALGISYQSQVNKVKEHAILGSTVLLSNTVAADGKEREMLCLPIKHIFGWLFSINPENVSEVAKEPLIKYQEECYNVLYYHFFGQQQKIIEMNKREIDLLKDKEHIKDKISEMKNDVKLIEKELFSLQVEKQNPQLMLNLD